MPTIEMIFQVDTVTHSRNPVDQVVLANQEEPVWSNPDFRSCLLRLGIINDDTLKRFAPGQQLRVTIEY